MPPHGDAPKAHRTDQARSRAAVAAGALLLMLMLGPPLAVAGEVTGTVTLDGRPVPPGTTLTLRRAGGGGSTITVPIDQRSGYRVFLEPGHYEATLAGAPGATTLRSFPAAVRQNLSFKR